MYAEFSAGTNIGKFFRKTNNTAGHCINLAHPRNVTFNAEILDEEGVLRVKLASHPKIMVLRSVFLDETWVMMRHW